MEHSCLTDIGLKKAGNEDSVAINRLCISSNAGIIDFALLVVADGVGGLEAGEAASYQAIKTISDNFATTASALAYNFKHKLAMGDYVDWYITNMLTRAIKEANYAIYGKTLSSALSRSSATTVCAVVIQSDKAYIANVGDSRAYIINKDTITRKTIDHSVVENMLRRGEITEEEAFTHPQRNIITRAVGDKEDVEVDIYKDMKLNKDEYILVCSDGLTDLLKEEEIHEIVLESQTVEEMCRKLVDKANEYGGKDNISVVIAKMDHLAAEKEVVPTPAAEQKVESKGEAETPSGEPKAEIEEKEAKPETEEEEDKDTSLPEPDEKQGKICSGCGHKNPVGEMFCEKCGFDLGF